MTNELIVSDNQIIESSNIISPWSDNRYAIQPFKDAVELKKEHTNKVVTKAVNVLAEDTTFAKAILEAKGETQYVLDISDTIKDAISKGEVKLDVIEGKCPIQNWRKNIEGEEKWMI